VQFEYEKKMQRFNDTQHTEVESEDGSFTAYSKEYDEHYHSTKDGALNESYMKHIVPMYQLQKSKKTLNILDICYGLGFNTLCTILYYKKYAPQTTLNIYSPELDGSLVKSLEFFRYPDEFEVLRDIIVALSRDGVYRDEQFYIEVFIGDAREYVKGFKEYFDIVYQDAFSPSVNPALWTQEYFADIARAMKNDGVLSSYSTALKTRLALYRNGFFIYLNEGEGHRNATIASLLALEGLKKVDMEHKIACNSAVEPLKDAEV
jgi:tRNA U34 5-methylaminomethyl-2-thiouridine-forming methyltransferase MnmC